MKMPSKGAALPVPPKIVVIGSLNVDMVASVRRLPLPGETIAASQLSISRGGKGGNQLLAAMRQGAQGSMIACIGPDSHGTEYRRFLLEQGIDIQGIATVQKENTGTALIAVDADGENQIIYSPGANARLSASRVRIQGSLIRAASILLVQMETPIAALAEGIRIANRAGIPVILNLSPFRDDFPWNTSAIDTLVLNETEAADLFQTAVKSLPRQLSIVRGKLDSLNVRRAVITRGANSTLCLEAERSFTVPALPVKKVVDTVGAGDTFTGVLAVRLAEGMPLDKAVRFANCAGALATKKAGAQASIPTRLQTERAAQELPV